MICHSRYYRFYSKVGKKFEKRTDSGLYKENQPVKPYRSDAGDWQRCKEALRGADRAVQELCDTLDFTYDLAKQLYQIYHFSKDAIAKSMYKKDLTELAQAERMMESLRSAFEKVASEDDSAPLMSNTEQVYAGFTYGKENLVENYQNPNGSRGFLA